MTERYKRLALWLAAFIFLALYNTLLTVLLARMLPGRDDLQGTLHLVLVAPYIPAMLILDLRRARKVRQFADISRNEQALRIEYERLQGRTDNLLEAVEVMVWTFDPERRQMLHVSSACRKLFGLTESQLLEDASLLWGSLHEQDLPELDKLWTAIARMRPYECEVRIRHAEGSVRWVHCRIFPTLAEDAKSSVVHGAILDVTARKQLEQHLENDLLLARIVQQTALTEPLRTDRFRAEARYTPSRMLGGDMYAWYPIDENRFGVLLLDVMGKGVAASLIGMSAHALLGRLIPLLVDPAGVMEELNRHIMQMYRRKEMPVAFFMTAIYLVIDLNQGELVYVNAGHPDAYLASKDGTMVGLGSTTIPIGLLEPYTAEARCVPCSRDGRLLLYTDGLLEQDGQTAAQASAWLQEALARGLEQPLPDFLDELVEATGRSLPAEREQDDLCIVGLDLQMAGK